jgi:hypothetical protein
LNNVILSSELSECLEQFSQLVFLDINGRRCEGCWHMEPFRSLFRKLLKNSVGLFITYHDDTVDEARMVSITRDEIGEPFTLNFVNVHHIFLDSWVMIFEEGVEVGTLVFESLELPPSEEAIDSILEFCKNLRTIRIACPFFECFLNLIQNCTTLRKLEFSGFTYRDNDIVNICNLNPAITHLEVYGCDNFAFAAAEKIFASHNDMVSIVCFSCTKMSQTHRDAIVTRIGTELKMTFNCQI